MESVINYIKDLPFVFKIIAVLLVITIYSVISVLINKLYNAKHGKTTILAWIPPFNIFLLGTLVIHFIVGLLLVIGLLFGICISVNITGLETIHNLLPSEYVLPYQIAYIVIIVLLLLFGKSKLNRLIRNGATKDTANSFINKDYDNKEPDIVASKEEVKEVKEMIEDNYQYNHTSLSSLNTHNDNKNNQ